MSHISLGFIRQIFAKRCIKTMSGKREMLNPLSLGILVILKEQKHISGASFKGNPDK